MTAMPKTMYPFGAIIVVANPASKNAATANRCIERLQKRYPGMVQLLETDPDLAVTRHTLLEALTVALAANKEPVLGVAGGDGTVNVVLQILTGPGLPSYVQEIPIVPLGTGNANDLAWMLYEDPSNVERLFSKGQPVRIRPLECYITAPGGLPERHVAASYVSFGAMAHGAHALNAPEVRQHPLLKAWYGDFIPDFMAVRAAVQAPAFTIKQVDGSNKQLRDLLFGNGGRVAKVGKMPARIDRPEIYVTTVEENWMGRSAIPIGAIRLALGRMPGELLKDEQYIFTTIDEVAAQFDGEPTYILPGSTVIVTSSKTTFCALATKL